MKQTDFDRRLAEHYDELKWLYCRLYHNDEQALAYFVQILRCCWEGRKTPLRDQDTRRESDPTGTAAGIC